MSTKKSNFVAQPVIPSGASFDYFVNGQNFKIPYEDLKTLLGFGNGNPNTNNVFTSLDYSIQASDDFVVGTGVITLTFPLGSTAVKALTIKNDGVSSITLDGNGATIEDGLTLTTTQAETYLYDDDNTNWVKVT